jgi:hypothetical protein
MPRDNKKKLWEPSELTGVLEYVNDNFDPWLENHQKTGNKAVEARNINRDGRSVYNKIYNLTKDMRIYYETHSGNIPVSKIIRENKKIRELVKEIWRKTEERRKKENKVITEDSKFDDDIKDILKYADLFFFFF